MPVTASRATKEPAVEADPAIGRFLDAVWMERGLSQNTLAAYRADLTALSRWLEERRMRVTRTTRADLLAFIAWRVEAGARPRSTARQLSSFRRFFRFMVREGSVTEDPTAQIEMPKIGRSLPKSLTEDEVEALLAAPTVTDPLGHRDRTMLEVLYATGLRVSELVSLTWSHLLDREDDKVQIAGLVGKGGKEREVLLPADLANRLREVRQGAGDDEAVFKGRPSRHRKLKDRPEGAMSARAVAQVIKRTARRAALPKGTQERISPHWLRHAHASHALDNKAPISLVQQTLGHGSLKTTSIYAHAKPGDSSALYLKKVR